MWSKRLPTFNVVGAVALSYLAMSSGHSPGGEEVSAGVAGPTLGPELEPKVTYFLRDKDRDDGGCKEDEQCKSGWGSLTYISFVTVSRCWCDRACKGGISHTWWKH